MSDKQSPTDKPSSAQETGPMGKVAADAAPASTAQVDTVDPRILEILVCPLTKTRLRYDKSKNELISTAAGLAYPIRDGVPMMSMEAARQLADNES
ncbi:MAG: Trm112 family protein [Pseudomonadota bacterium]